MYMCVRQGKAVCISTILCGCLRLTTCCISGGRPEYMASGMLRDVCKRKSKTRQPNMIDPDGLKTWLLPGIGDPLRNCVVGGWLDKADSEVPTATSPRPRCKRRR